MCAASTSGSSRPSGPTWRTQRSPRSGTSSAHTAFSDSPRLSWVSKARLTAAKHCRRLLEVRYEPVSPANADFL